MQQHAGTKSQNGGSKALQAALSNMCSHDKLSVASKLRAEGLQHQTAPCTYSKGHTLRIALRELKFVAPAPEMQM